MNLAMRNGQRSTSYVEYVKPYEGSRNTLTVIRYANVSEVPFVFLYTNYKTLTNSSNALTQILLDNNKNAYGVAYTRHGLPQIAHAQKEIILSAGVFSSPLLLMKSGIGPESVLNAAEVRTHCYISPYVMSCNILYFESSCWNFSDSC